VPPKANLGAGIINRQGGVIFQASMWKAAGDAGAADYQAIAKFAIRRSNIQE